MLISPQAHFFFQLSVGSLSGRWPMGCDLAPPKWRFPSYCSVLLTLVLVTFAQTAHSLWDCLPFSLKQKIIRGRHTYNSAGLGHRPGGHGRALAPRARCACAPPRPCRAQRERRVRGCRGDWNTTWRPEGSAGSGAGSGPAAAPPAPAPAGRRGMHSKGVRGKASGLFWGVGRARSLQGGWWWPRGPWS